MAVIKCFIYIYIRQPRNGVKSIMNCLLNNLVCSLSMILTVHPPAVDSVAHGKLGEQVGEDTGSAHGQQGVTVHVGLPVPGQLRHLQLAALGAECVQGHEDGGHHHHEEEGPHPLPAPSLLLAAGIGQLGVRGQLHLG